MPGIGIETPTKLKNVHRVKVHFRLFEVQSKGNNYFSLHFILEKGVVFYLTSGSFNGMKCSLKLQNAFIFTTIAELRSKVPQPSTIKVMVAGLLMS